MTDREKLIEILQEPIFPHEMVDPIEAVADHLLANGVMVQKHGRWERLDDDWVDLWKCTACGEEWTFGYDPTSEETTVTFCPNCGARMDGE